MSLTDSLPTSYTVTDTKYLGNNFGSDLGKKTKRSQDHYEDYSVSVRGTISQTSSITGVTRQQLL